MDILSYLRRQFSYDAWANREVLTGLQKSAAHPEKPRQLLAHILSAERLWLERILGQRQSQAVWPDLPLEKCDVEISALARQWNDFLATQTADSIAQTIHYKNSKGEPWSSTAHDIITHVLLHSAYHRGQIAMLVRAAGETPAYTDFIHAVRNGFIE